MWETDRRSHYTINNIFSRHFQSGTILFLQIHKIGSKESKERLLHELESRQRMARIYGVCNGVPWATTEPEGSPVWMRNVSPIFQPWESCSDIYCPRIYGDGVLWVLMFQWHPLNDGLWVQISEWWGFIAYGWFNGTLWMMGVGLSWSLNDEHLLHVIFLLRVLPWQMLVWAVGA